MKTLRNISNTLAKPIILHFTLPILMSYLLVGTIAQKYIGLYDATEIFFSDTLIWIGPIPLPGLPIIMAVITLNLAFKLIFKSPWRLQNAGNIVTHIGALMLLIGGLLTAITSHEGYVDLAPGSAKNFAADYHQRDIVVLDNNGNTVFAMPHIEANIGDVIALDPLPYTIEIKEHCRNCAIQPREYANETFIGMAQHMQLSPDRPDLLDEKNLTGITIALTPQAAPEEKTIHVALEDVPQVPEFEHDGETYSIAIRRHRRDLPFDIELLEFTRDMHPGTAMAKEYSSLVRIIDGDTQWESLISMNQPLRYKGYTFFQSSFVETPQGDVSVLAAVWNQGRAFPYISGILMCLGITLHLFTRRLGGTKNKGGKNHA